jgi:hypothetical protein
MSNELYALALTSTLQEIQNVCPDITSNFIFKDGKILAKDKNTEEETATQTIDAFNKITESADIIGGLEAVTIQGAEGKVNIAAMNDFHLTTVSSKEADEKYVNTLTRVLIPIVIKLVDEIQPASIETETITSDDETITQVEPEPVEDEVTEEVFEEPEVEEAENAPTEELDEEAAMRKLYEDTEPVELEVDDEPLLPEPPVTQLMVENLKGFRVPSDTVRVDEDVIAQWNELYSDKKLDEVEIEALNGKTTRCKVKEIKKSKDSGKGIIKMPEKIQLTLEIAAGELVTVKPVVE